jgi:biotin-(acetyl-CoA carboxylase) ligase
MVEGTAPPLGRVLLLLLEGLNRRYDEFSSSGASRLTAELRRRSSYLEGRRILVDTGSEEIAGTTAGLEGDGSLWLRLDSGEQILLRAGDVRVLD